MSELIAIVGGSGEGKSTSIETLDPQKTYIINVAGKPLPFKGWKGNYIKDNPKDKSGNYIDSTNSTEISHVLTYIDTQRPEINVIVIDDAQYCMATEAMNRALEKGYDKWTEMAKHLWDIINTARTLHRDIKVVFCFHDEVVSENYAPKRKIKTLGAMIDKTITLEGLFTVVLFTHVSTDPKTKVNLYQFCTQTQGGTTAKSPKGMFDLLIPNDLAYVCQKIDEYYS